MADGNRWNGRQNAGQDVKIECENAQATLETQILGRTCESKEIMKKNLFSIVQKFMLETDGI